MTKADFKALASRRFLAAENDLKSARVILNEGGYLGTTCFLAQQIVEKYLKGYLIYRGKDPGKVHALFVLLKRCAQVDKTFERFEDDCRDLDKYYIEPRYADLPIEYSKSEATLALDKALAIREHIREKLKLD
ncbi:hypothetical protein A3F45_00950 [Candidatus Curtissbacteria bacterium RIFCSPHIGHO2_12_FULL_41_17]|uniref:HEPN domain-containing protein n=2 Tax=Microgenomates group TaxID=1794810 RepID=A0A1F7JTM8_9BACT|nr:MAG: hypothetical protein A3F45_00950 [Candidatus Curtissbacteria bacterium RIFCSPHIGHO2_12_FULL_41_17]OGK58957.1 MAG: hypothetical protein A3I56_01330 [Candidatus Roizmanbacteria bacterium RIFCSPLOWO2_02_FULL_43_10]